MADRFAAWVVLLLVLLLPIFFALSNRLTDGRVITAEGLLGGGDLFLLSVALCAAAGEDLGNLRREGAAFRLVVGVLLVMVGWSCFWYADVARTVRSGGFVNERAVMAGSLLLFGCAALLRLGVSLAGVLGDRGSQRSGGEG